MDRERDLRDLGVNAYNRDFSRFDQVKKEQTYRLSESGGGDEAFDDDFVIRTCDMTDWFHGGEEGRRRFSSALGQAMEEIGFAILTGHGIDPALFERTDRAVRSFFETIPMSERLPYLAQRHGSVNQGYFPLKETTIIHPDLVHGWVFCRRAFDLDGRAFDAKAFWPRPEYEPIFRQLVRAEQDLVLPVMQSILAYLGCDPHLYDEKLAATNFGFRLNYYPAPAALEETPSGGRMLGHEDVDLFTFLPAPTIEGLQVLNRRNMKWIRLHAPPGSIILNTGDYMQRITNDRLPSTTHRVSQPRDRDAARRARVSFPMAVYVWEEEMLEVLPGLGEPKYPPVSAIAFHTHTTAKYYGESYAVDHA